MASNLRPCKTDPVPKRDPIEGVRDLCLGLPEVSERLSHGAPTWFIRAKLTG